MKKGRRRLEESSPNPSKSSERRERGSDPLSLLSPAPLRLYSTSSHDREKPKRVLTLRSHLSLSGLLGRRIHGSSRRRSRRSRLGSSGRFHRLRVRHGRASNVEGRVECGRVLFGRGKEGRKKEEEVVDVREDRSGVEER